MAAFLGLASFVGYRATVLVSKLSQPRPANRAHLVDAPKYETLLGQELSGSGFHFKVEDRVYLCATLHQFDGDMPTMMMSFEFDDPIEVLGQVHKQRDVQVLSFKSEKLTAIPPLSYRKAPAIDLGMPVYIYTDDGVVEGHVTSLFKRKGKVMIKPVTPFAAGGQSGSPIVNGETGDVVAVLVGANSAERATRVEAELLSMP